MSKTKHAPPPPSAIDVSSEAIVVFYVGDGPIYGDAPARDLNGADLARLVRIQALRESGGEPVKAAKPEQLEALVAQLCSSGAFAREMPEIDPDTTEEPAAPAKENS